MFLHSGGIIALDADNAADVAVGGLTATEKLDVNGKIRMRTGATAGYVPVADANGVMTWTDPSTLSIGNSGALEEITDGANTGYRIVGRNPANYLPIGDNAVDLSNSTTPTSGASGNNSSAMGLNTTASGDRSFVAGLNTTASGNNSTAMGKGTTASGNNSMAMNLNTIAIGNNSTAMGNATTASGSNSTAMGDATEASGENSMAMGANTIASGVNSTAMGAGTTASNGRSFAAGQNSTASGNQSFAMGYNATASGFVSTAVGQDVIASAESSTAMGYYTEASGFASTAMGSFTDASGLASTAMGKSTDASGENSTAMGYATIASGENSTAMGSGTNAKSLGEFVIGLNNTDYTPAAGGSTSFNASDRLFVIGNGTSTTSRSDAMIVYKNGNIEIDGDIEIDGGAAIQGDATIFGYTNFIGDMFIDGNALITSNTAIGGDLDLAGNAALNDGQLRLRGIGDPNHYIAYHGDPGFDGAKIRGNQTISLQTGNMEVVLRDGRMGVGTASPTKESCMLRGTQPMEMLPPDGLQTTQGVQEHTLTIQALMSASIVKAT